MAREIIPIVPSHVRLSFTNNTASIKHAWKVSRVVGEAGPQEIDVPNIPRPAVLAHLSGGPSSFSVVEMDIEGLRFRINVTQEQFFAAIKYGMQAGEQPGFFCKFQWARAGSILRLIPQMEGDDESAANKAAAHERRLRLERAIKTPTVGDVYVNAHLNAWQCCGLVSDNGASPFMAWRYFGKAPDDDKAQEDAYWERVSDDWYEKLKTELPYSFLSGGPVGKACYQIGIKMFDMERAKGNLLYQLRAALAAGSNTYVVETIERARKIEMAQ